MTQVGVAAKGRGLDGLSFARELKSDPRTADIGIVLLTGSDLDPETACEAGAAGVVKKPFSPIDLLAGVGLLETNGIAVVRHHHCRDLNLVQSREPGSSRAR